MAGALTGAARLRDQILQERGLDHGRHPRRGPEAHTHLRTQGMYHSTPPPIPFVFLPLLRRLLSYVTYISLFVVCLPLGRAFAWFLIGAALVSACLLSE